MQARPYITTMTFNRKILAIFIFLTPFLSFCQGEKARVDSIYKLKSIIQNNNIVASQGVGYAGMPSRHWYSFSFLLSLSTNDELLEMTYDSTAAVRLYAYIGLVHNKYSYLEIVKKRLLSDTAYLYSIEGCIWRLYEYVLIDITLLSDISSLQINPSFRIYFHLHIFTQHQSGLT
jgi:hypothetical protein